MFTKKELFELLDTIPQEKRTSSLFIDLKRIANDSSQSNIDLIDRNNYIATKLWCWEDVENTLNEMLDYQLSNAYKQYRDEIEMYHDEILENVNPHDLNVLCDCTDSDWNIIQQSIEFSIENVLHFHNIL